MSSSQVLFVQDTANRRTAVLLANFMAYLGHVESMSAVEELAHSFCNLLDISDLDEQSPSFPDKIRDAANSG